MKISPVTLVNDPTNVVLVEKGQNNLAFATLFQLGDTKSCVDLLIKTQRIPEAAIFARTYAPRYVFSYAHRFRRISHPASTFSQVPKVVEIWREDLSSNNRQKLATRIASPGEQPDAFPEGWGEVLELEHSSGPDGILVDL